MRLGAIAGDAAAVERVRELVRAAVLEQSCPGLPVAVGIGLPSGASATEGGTLVWAEGSDGGTSRHGPVTPDTRFNIGTAASAVTATVAPLGLADTGAPNLFLLRLRFADSPLRMTFRRLQPSP
jgi:hypothetical protein